MIGIKELMDRALFALSVPKCVGCGEKLDYRQNALCSECSAVFQDFKTRQCSRCKKTLNKCDCTTDFLKSHFISRTLKCYRYIDRDESIPSNALIYSLKRDNRNDVLKVCTDELEAAILNSVDNPENFIFTNIPRREAAIIEYGIDHSELLAKSLSKRFKADYVPLLKSKSKKPQKTLERIERLKNAEFYINKTVDLTNKSVIIIDDIITSGASMGAAATLIRSLGCKNIIAASLAIAYRDN